MTPEEHRILRAANGRRLLMNEAGRWIIAGDARPDRRARERCQSKGWLRWSWQTPTPALILTSEGRAALNAVLENARGA